MESGSAMPRGQAVGRAVCHVKQLEGGADFTTKYDTVVHTSTCAHVDKRRPYFKTLQWAAMWWT